MTYQDDSSDDASTDSTFDGGNGSNGNDSSDSSDSSDAGASSDGATSDDASTVSASDGGTSDAGTSDAGTSDAGTSDGGSSDAGTSDAGTSDGGSSDAGTSSTSSSVDLTATVPIPSGINANLSSASQATMLTALGNPGTPDPGCGPVAPALQSLMKTASVGPFRVTGLSPAVDALTRVFAAVQSARPDLYAALGTAGMLCVRYVRGSTTNFSNHSWGTAIDMTIGGVLTQRGSTTVTQGLVDLAPFMAAESFFWGAGFNPTPDGMHFEASNELISQWKANGTIP